MIQTICKSTDFKPNDIEKCSCFINKATDLTVTICPTDFHKISIGGYSDIVVTDKYMREYYEKHPDCDSDSMDVFIRKLQEFLPEGESVAIQIVEYEKSDTDYRKGEALIEDVSAYGIVISQDGYTDLNMWIILNNEARKLHSGHKQGDE